MPLAPKLSLWPYVVPVLLLVCSNIFMTLAWYGHLKFKTSPIFLVIVVSWGIAFVEYCFMVPANRMGNAVYSPAELKSIQEVITLIVFAAFTAIYFGNRSRSFRAQASRLLRLARCWFSRATPEQELEATPGIEPGCADLQSAASPLRHVANLDAANT